MTDEVPASVATSPRWHRHLELTATIMLAVATVMTAWSAFQANKWNAVQTRSYSAAGAHRTESTKASTLAGQQQIIDVLLFTDWLQATADETGGRLPTTYVEDPGTYSTFLYRRFRPEFEPALQAWLAADPGTNASAPSSPFVMPEYKLEAREKSAALERAAEASAATARQATARAGNYVLATVLCASVLFFCGIGLKLSSPRRRAWMVGCAAVLLLTTLIVLATFPVQL
ncbi:hypothetical protein [Cellulomonas sp. URHE0023]|uniref:hypothetical protein n=1 Tax=Cellulomonas sp. URHE0023 TaxID=1380354 RepID=UPI000A9733A4|nr:hypothetical protein [Cellulomonas sp. URHE0023]